MNTQKLNTYTFNDVGISYGPSVHFLELWNSFQNLYSEQYTVKGFYPSWTQKSIITPTSFEVKKINVPNIPLFRQLITDIFFAYYLIQNRKEINYIRLSNFGFFLLIAIKIFNIKYYLELNGIIAKDNLSAGKGKFYTLLSNFQEKFLIKKAVACISVSDGITEFAKSIGCKEVITLANGISTDFFKLPQKEKITNDIVYVGTFTPWDGAIHIVELAKQNPNIQFHMIGEGPHRKLVEEKAPPNMKFYGYRLYHELKSIYQNYDAGIVLYPIARNDMKLSSLKTLEYIASGLPVFTTRVPGQEFIEDNQIGICSELENVNEQFLKFIENLATFKENISLYRKENMNQLSWNRVALETEKLIQKTHK